LGTFKRIKIGQADILLNHGIHTYIIEYSIENQIRFFDGYDEIYWNVTGNEWNFAIQNASVKIVLPSGAEIIKSAAYTGYYGDKSNDSEGGITARGIWEGHTRNVLNPGMGYTVAVGFAKGIIKPPSVSDIKKETWIRDRIYYAGIAGVFLTIILYMLAWIIVGKDPRKGVIIPRFEPPSGFSPATCRSIFNMGYDKKAFTATLIGMAVKGALTIEKSDWSFILQKTITKPQSLIGVEVKILQKLFSTGNKLELKKSNYSNLKSALDYHESNVNSELSSIFFRLNRNWLSPGILSSILTILILWLWTYQYDSDSFIGMAITSMFLLFILPFLIFIINQFRAANGVIRIILSIVLFIILFFFSSMAITILYTLSEDAGINTSLIIFYLGTFIVLFFTGILFGYLIKAPTRKGRQLMDEIEGLKLYLGIAERDRLEMMNPPDQTPSHFEVLLPYAIALDVERNWAKRFEPILKQASASGQVVTSWYNGGIAEFNAIRFTSDIGSSFNSAISNYSTPPSSSSSGSGGGGFSGGGGGGGGGGGW
jgi:uncharacterized membrane protein YgcG